MAVDNFLALTASMARSPKVWLPALLLGATLGHAPSARALVIFDNTNNLTTANGGANPSYNSGSNNTRFINTTGTGTGSNNGVAIPLLASQSFYLNDASLQISANVAGARDIGFYLYESTPAGTDGNNANTTQLYTPVGGPLASTTLNFTPGSATNSYSTFNFSGTNLGSYLLAAGKTYLLMTGNVTTTGNRAIAFGNAAGTSGDLLPSTTNLITWNNSGSTGCTPTTCKTDTFNTTNGGQTLNRNNQISTLWRINGSQPVPAPLPLVGAGLAFGYSRRLRRRTLGQQTSA